MYITQETICTIIILLKRWIHMFILIIHSMGACVNSSKICACGSRDHNYSLYLRRVVIVYARKAFNFFCKTNHVFITRHQQQTYIVQERNCENEQLSVGCIHLILRERMHLRTVWNNVSLFKNPLIRRSVGFKKRMHTRLIHTSPIYRHQTWLTVAVT